MQKPSPKTQIISASLGAVLTTLLMTPFDVIKTRMQVKSTSSTSLEMARLIVKKEGITKLWRGLIPTMGFVLPQTVFYLVTYEKLKQILNNSPGTAGALSRGLAVSLISPVELIRTQIQSQSDSGKIVCGEIIRNVKSNGIGYLWRGLAPTLARDVPFSALYWIGIEKFKSFYDGKMYTYQQELGLSFLNGSVSGMVNLCHNVRLPQYSHILSMS
jgi:solute carrier family 25 protein 39/40